MISLNFTWPAEKEGEKNRGTRALRGLPLCDRTMRKERNFAARKIEQVSQSLENSKVEGWEDMQGAHMV